MWSLEEAQDPKLSSEPVSVWEYFVKNSDRQSATCQTCFKVLKSTGGSTKGLHDHLKLHKITAKKRSGTEHGHSSNESGRNISSTSTYAGPSKKKNKIGNIVTVDKYFENGSANSFEAVVSRMVARDGLPLSIFCTSPDLRDLLKASGYNNIPTNPMTIKNIVCTYTDGIKMLQKWEIQQKKDRGTKFHISFDEWTSNRNRRYLNIYLIENSTELWNLGMLRMHGSFSAEKCIALIDEKLKEFNLSLQSDIVAIVTDRESSMTKIEKLVPCFQQLCFAHGVQLAILDVLYKNAKPKSVKSKQGKFIVNNEESEIESDISSNHSNVDQFENNCKLDTVNLTLEVSDIYHTFDIESGSSESESELLEIDNESESRISFEKSPPIAAEVMHEKVGPLIKKVREVVKHLKRSPTKNDNHLQQHVKAEFGKTIPLILDCKTRWSSLYDMMNRFLKLKACVLKSILDLKSAFTLSDEEFTLMKDIVETLEPIKACVEALCRRDANLLVADIALKFALTKLEKQGSNLSLELLEALTVRIAQRRTNLSGLLQYLHVGKQNSVHHVEAIVEDASTKHPNNNFPVPRTDKICPILTEIITRLYLTQAEDMALSSTASSNTTEEIADIEEECLEGFEMFSECLSPNAKKARRRDMKKKTPLESELDSLIKDSLSSSVEVNCQTRSLQSTIKRELLIFEEGGSKGHYLEIAYEYLKSIPATSIESEKAFSSASNICSKFRSRLNDDALDAICILRSHFQLQS